MGKRWMICIILISTLLLPMALIYAADSVEEALPETTVGLNLSYFIDMTSDEYDSIYLSLLSIEVTVILAFVIYWLQYNNEKRAEKEEIRRAKRTLLVMLTNATARAFEIYNDKERDLPFHFIRITDHHIGLIAVIGHLLSEKDKEFLYLNRIMETLKDMAEYEKDDAPWEARRSLNQFMQLITMPFYPLYHFKMDDVDSIYDVMNEEAIHIFDVLATDQPKVHFSHGIKYNAAGNILFENFF